MTNDRQEAGPGTGSGSAVAGLDRRAQLALPSEGTPDSTRAMRCAGDVGAARARPSPGRAGHDGPICSAWRRRFPASPWLRAAQGTGYAVVAMAVTIARGPRSLGSRARYLLGSWARKPYWSDQAESLRNCDEPWRFNVTAVDAGRVRDRGQRCSRSGSRSRSRLPVES